jgi:outer membrane protein assembly factor BamB
MFAVKRYTMLRAGIAVICLYSTVASCAAGDVWASWRGPNGNGSAGGGGFPLEWSAEENIRWMTELKGLGASTPIVAGDRIFVTTTDAGNNRLLCLDLDGHILWEGKVGESVAGKPGKDGTGANPSAITDGESVFVYFKSGDLACFDFSGELQWQTNLQQRFGEDTLWWDLGTSPVLIDDAVVIACMHSGPSYLAAFAKKNGKLLWKHDRDLGAPEEAAQSYATPVVISEDGHQTIVVLGADHVTAHDAKNGDELWRVGGLNPTNHKYFRSIASASVADGIVVAPYARGDSLTAVRLGGTGDVTKTHVIWANKDTSADVPTPAILDGRVFICRDVKQNRGTIDCLDLHTGQTIWSGQLPRHAMTFRSSPIVADGRLYVTRQDGTVFVVDARADEFRLLATNSIGRQHMVATPVFVNGTILLRTDSRLYCVGLDQTGGK